MFVNVLFLFLSNNTKFDYYYNNSQKTVKLVYTFKIAVYNLVSCY